MISSTFTFLIFFNLIKTVNLYILWLREVCNPAIIIISQWDVIFLNTILHLKNKEECKTTKSFFFFFNFSKKKPWENFWNIYCTINSQKYVVWGLNLLKVSKAIWMHVLYFYMFLKSVCGQGDGGYVYIRHLCNHTYTWYIY